MARYMKTESLTEIFNYGVNTPAFRNHWFVDHRVIVNFDPLSAFASELTGPH